MSIISSIKSAYTKVDKSVGGYLPGGVTPQQAKQQTIPTVGEVTTQQQASSVTSIKGAVEAGVAKAPTIISGGGGGGSSGGYFSAESPTAFSPTEQPKEIIQTVGEVTPQQGNTLTNQYEKQSVVSAAKDYGFVKPYQSSFVEATKGSLYNIGYDVKQFFTGRDSSAYRGGWFEPFGMAGLGRISLGLGSSNIIGLNTPNIKFSKQTTGEAGYLAGVEYGKATEKSYNEYSTNLNKLVSEVSTSTQSQYDTGFNLAQENVNIGAWNLEQGNIYLKKLSQSLDLQGKTKIEGYAKETQKQFETSLVPLQEQYKTSSVKSGFGFDLKTGPSYTIDTGKAIEIGIPLGVTLGVMAVAPFTGTGLIGLKELSLGSKESDMPRILGGAALMLSPVAMKLAKLPTEISVGESTEALAREKFLFQEKRFIGKTDSFIVKGTRKAGGLKQDILIKGTSLKEAKFGFLQPGSPYATTISGEIPSAWKGGLTGFKPQAYVGFQSGQIGAKGLSFPVTGVEGLSVSLGKVNLVPKFETYGMTDLTKIKGSGTTFSQEKLGKDILKNMKSYEFGTKYQTDYFAGVSEKLNEEFYLTKSGKITSMKLNPSWDLGKIRVEKESLSINANLKDLTLTEIIPQADITTMRSFVKETKIGGGGKGLIGIQKTSMGGGAEILNKAAVQGFKESFVPAFATKTSSLSMKGLSAGGLGLATIQTGKTKNDYSTFVSSASLGLTGSNQYKLKTSQLTSSAFKQPQAQSQFSGQLQLTKLDLGTMKTTVQAFATPNIAPGFGSGFGWGGFGGFPPLSLPSFGSGLGVVKRKTKGKRKKTRIAPSLTSELFDLRGALPKGGSFGITPFQLRRIPKGKGNPYETKF